MSDLKQEILIAEKRIRAYIRQTPLEYSIPLSHQTSANVYLKCENLQYTNSFKARGAFNKLLSLTSAERERGIVAASSGNHGAAIAYGLKTLNIPGTVFVPKNASSTKIKNIKNYGARLEYHGTDTMQTEMHALQYAQKNHQTYISPYNDLKVIGGQGTIGLELSKQLKKIDAVLVAVGGGGLISGVAGYLKSVNPSIKMIGCLPQNSPIMAESIRAGRIIEMDTQPTLSDATAGGIEPGALTFELCQQLIDDYILVSENEIKNAVNTVIRSNHLLIEGAAGVTIAALLKSHQRFNNQTVVAILSGGNISLETLKSIILTSE